VSNNYGLTVFFYRHLRCMVQETIMHITHGYVLCLIFTFSNHGLQLIVGKLRIRISQLQLAIHYEITLVTMLYSLQLVSHLSDRQSALLVWVSTVRCMVPGQVRHQHSIIVPNKLSGQRVNQLSYPVSHVGSYVNIVSIYSLF